MSDQWRRTTLGDVADVLMGQSPPGTSYNADGVGLPFMQGSAEFGEHFPNPAKWCSQPAKVAQPGDLMVSVRAPVGDTNFADREIAIGRGLAVVRGRDGATTRFLRLAVQHGVAELLARSGSGMFSSITAANLKGFDLLLPPPDVQRRIVDLIAAVDANAEALAAEAVAGVDAQGPLFQSLVVRATESSEAVRLGEVGEFVRGRRFTKAEYVPSGLGCIHYGQIHTHFGPVARKSLTFLLEESRSRLRLARPGDVVIAATSEDIDGLGKATVWLGDDDVAVHDDCYIFRHMLDPVFASYVFASPWFQHQKRQYAGGTKVTRISGADLARIAIPIPPSAVQTKIGEALSGLSDHVHAVRGELDAVRQLRMWMLTALLSRRVEIPESYGELLNRVAEDHLEAS